MQTEYDVIVVGAGHAGTEAAWACANLLRQQAGDRPRVALVTLDPAKTGVMSCNPAIGGLAKGQIVREVDALNGLMGLAADATGIQFKMLNTSKGPAVRGPRAQCDKHAYAEAVQHLLHARPEIQVVAGAADDLLIERGTLRGVRVTPSHAIAPETDESRDVAHTFAHPPITLDGPLDLLAPAVIITTGTFMRGLMHTGESKTQGGRFGEGAAVGISGTLSRLGFELARLKTGTPPRLDRNTIDWDALEPMGGDQPPTPFSELTTPDSIAGIPGWDRFPLIEQIDCRIARTTPEAHDIIRANLDRAPMFSGQIESVGPRYCPSIEDKVVRFSDKESHHVFLEPESLRDEWVYCNGIATSLPSDVQDELVKRLDGCANARILRYGYAVEYDTVRPHQIDATCMTKPYPGLFLAGQINGTSGYEEAAAQGVLAGINAARFAMGDEPITLGRDEAYIGVLMDDLVTKTPVEPYRMFTSRAEHRLLLRADNAADRLTPIAERLGLLEGTDLGERRRAHAQRRRDDLDALHRLARTDRIDGVLLADVCRRPEFSAHHFAQAIPARDGEPWLDSAVRTAHTDLLYDAYIQRAKAEAARNTELDRKRIPPDIDFSGERHLRAETREALEKFRPTTLGQAARLAGVNPADITLISVLVARHTRAARDAIRSAP